MSSKQFILTLCLTIALLFFGNLIIFLVGASGFTANLLSIMLVILGVVCGLWFFRKKDE
jgi:uncharacterized membrane protein